MQMDLFVFDLDGTLIDSKLDLALAVNASRENAGMGPLEHELIYSYVGNGAPTLIRRALGPGASDKQAEQSLDFFYEYYKEHMLDNTGLYPGVQEALDELLEMGKPMAVLTNKPVRFSCLLVERLGLEGHFLRTYGGNSFETKKPDPYGLNLLMSELATPPERTIMVGDSAVDVQTANNAGVISCGVTYGLQPETFEQHRPEILVDDLRELAGMFDRAAASAPASNGLPVGDQIS
jgi:phosphoglycolate phosphatase